MDPLDVARPGADLRGLTLSADQVTKALERMREESVVEKYCRIQAGWRTTDVRADKEFQRTFNGFYRVRRAGAWQYEFYRVMEAQKAAPASFRKVLLDLFATTGRVEASFASKLVATVDPNSPVIDSVVLRHVGLRVTASGPADRRIERGVEVHIALGDLYAAYLSQSGGLELVAKFRERYPNADVTDVKVLDFVLWQGTRT